MKRAISVHTLAGFVLTMAIGCEQWGPSETSTFESDLSRQVADVDRAFSKMSAEKGMAAAFLAYASDDVIKMNPRQHPVIGIDQLRKSFEGQSGEFELTWEPLRSEASGGLGYTFGNYFLKTKTPENADTVFYGNYVTVWRKQPDNTWKFVLDGGNPTPGPSVIR